MTTQQQRTRASRARGHLAGPGEHGGADRHAGSGGDRNTDSSADRSAGSGTCQQRADGNAPHLHAVSAAAAGRARVDAGGTRLRLRALHAMGHGSARIARATELDEQAIQKITRGQVATVRTTFREAVTELYEAWWDKRPPERTRYERAAANSARRRARTGNWCTGAGLDDDHLDEPGYRPASGWHPATGTGIAEDIHMPTPERKAGIA